MTAPQPHPALARWPAGYVIETARHRIRPVDPGRAAEVNAAIRESAAELRPWMVWCQTLPTVEETRTFTGDHAAAFEQRTNGTLWAFDHEDRFVAATGFHPGHPELPSLAIGYWCRTSQTRQGHVTEIVRALTAVAFHHLDVCRLEITCDARNERSAAVARRAGFHHEGRRRHDVPAVDGTPRDTDVFSLVPGDPGISPMDGVRFGPG